MRFQEVSIKTHYTKRFFQNAKFFFSIDGQFVIDRENNFYTCNIHFHHSIFTRYTDKSHFSLFHLCMSHNLTIYYKKLANSTRITFDAFWGETNVFSNTFHLIKNIFNQSFLKQKKCSRLNSKS